MTKMRPVVQTFSIPEQADVGYTEPIRRYIKVNSTAGEVNLLTHVLQQSRYKSSERNWMDFADN
jgi:hypothetical protein